VQFRRADAAVKRGVDFLNGIIELAAMEKSFGISLPPPKQSDQTAFDLGTSFFEAAIRCLSPVQNPNDRSKITAPTSPAIVSIAFSAELFLKSLLLSQHKSTKHTHRLDKLFNDLESSTQARIIKESCKSKKITTSKFRKYLSNVSNAFVEWRYVFEGTGRIEIDVLFEISRSIYIYCRELHPDWNVDDYLHSRIRSPLETSLLTVLNAGGGRMIRVQQKS
jgi:HEPN domain